VYIPPYIPKQGDLIWVDFDPTKGREIKKRRPALVISSNLYNRKTKFVIVLPVTTTIRKESIYFNLYGYKIKGQVVTVQIRSLDLLPSAGRNIEFAERMNAYDFLQIVQMVSSYFDFENYTE